MSGSEDFVIKDRIKEITKDLNNRSHIHSKERTIDCKSYVSNFNKKIASVLYSENFDKSNQLFIPIRGDCYEHIKKDMTDSGFNLYFKNERIGKDCNCLRLFLYKRKLYFMDWICNNYE